jgi:hypothetical protein
MLAETPGQPSEVMRTRLVSTATPLNEQIGPIVDAFEATFNGSFESGIGPWVRTGTVSAVNRIGPVTPRDGSRMISLSTGPDGAQTTATLRRTVSVPASALSGGTLRLRLRYNYLSEEYPEFVGSIFNDSFTVKVFLPNGSQMTVVSESVNTTAWTPVTGINFPGGDNTVGQSGWRTGQVNIPASALNGSTSFEILVIDKGDAIFDSVAVLDGITVL